MVFVSSLPNRVTRTFRKIGPPLFSSSGNQSFTYTIRFTSTLSFECSCVRPICPVPYRFPTLQPFCAVAFAYFSFRVFPHRFHQFPGTAANFFHFWTVLSSSSEPVHKTAITFTYEPRFQCSIYQNRSEKFFGCVYPCLWRV